MFDERGVPIDHYIIQVDSGTQLETADPTYSFDIMYNTTLSVIISAHNCAGYSDPFPLEIEYEQGRGMIQKLMHVLKYWYNIMQIFRSTLPQWQQCQQCYLMFWWQQWLIIINHQHLKWW